MYKIAILIGFIICSNTLTAQSIIFSEDFSNGIPSNFQLIDADGQTPETAVSYFTNAWIAYNDQGDSCAASTSYYTDTIASEDYMILPQLSLQTFSKFSWEARTVDASYPDGYYVLLSTTDSAVTSFTDTLLTVYAEYFQWNRKSIPLDTMGYANQSVYIAFRNFTQEGFILLIDDIMLEGSDFASIEDNEEVAITVYPNPATNYISFDGISADEIIIRNKLGQIILRSPENTVDISTLPVGTYFATAINKEGAKTLPFVKE
ncbi:choice-of-anchor J domain-containing protein [Paracrocinitomix mangrovi]|uniref:T9SS-dependent choice-of-anchor J family protein n=1 Tax=Paracrocinitomix mangrovi TaxID=2862509 RepID=UPI001C8D5D79|nr:choice-of-anchor J domain-containing protein [Paracrocinitomix mangrovi]UKN02408.1 choice-of-anchor J domain-containing protein [Paracrocinitomix mangrovi]